MKNAISRLREKMKERQVPALLVSNIDNIGWLTGFTGSFGLAVVTAESGSFVSDSRYTEQAKEQVHDLPVATFKAPKESPDFLAEQVAQLGLKKLHFESNHATYDQWDKWRKKMSGVELVPGPDLLTELRLVKTPEEVDAIRRSCRLADACFEHILRLIQPGISEYDIGLEIEFYFRRNGAELAFAPIVVSGERSARPHGRPSEKKLERGDFVTLDFGARVDSYCSDITRTLVVSESSNRHREVYDQVLKAQLEALKAIKPGAVAKDVDAVARRVLDEKGLAQYFGHGLGHGLGRATHDGGRLGTGSETVLEPGQVWTVEPGVYISGFGGVRIEDDIVVTETGCEILTRSTKELLVLPRA